MKERENICLKLERGNSAPRKPVYGGEEENETGAVIELIKEGLQLQDRSH